MRLRKKTKILRNMSTLKVKTMKTSFLSIFILASFLMSCASQPSHLLTQYTPDAHPARGNDEIDVMLGPVPVEENKEVSKWIHYFQNRGYKHMSVYLERSNRYMSLMKEILAEEGVPEDLIYIALIESGFSSKAYSSASAVGYWQFIRGTGRRYGLKIDAYVDERRDFITATRAAANYFKSLYNLFGNWYLAMASYNAGENRVKRVVMKHQTRDFWHLARNKKLPRETVNYVPKFLAATLIAKDPEKYGFTNIKYKKPITFDTIALTHPVDLKKFAQHMKVPYKTIRALNPAFLSRYAPVYRTGGVILKVPKGYELRGTLALQKARVKFNYKKSYAYYKVRRGDTVSGIARKLRVSIKQIQRLNGFSHKSIIRIGQKLKVPTAWIKTSSRRKSKSSKKRNLSSVSKTVTQSAHVQTYKVKKGDNLSKISSRFNTNVSKLSKLNNISAKSTLRPGQVLKLNQPKKIKIKYHSVKKGESLYVIAKRYNTNISTLKELNSLSKNMLKVGQSLIVRKW